MVLFKSVLQLLLPYVSKGSIPPSPPIMVNLFQ